MTNTEKLKIYLKNNLSERRYEHSLLVADEAKQLAKHYNSNEEKCYLAGLIHDIAKELTDEENNQIIEKYNLPNEIKNPDYKSVVHAEIGSVLAKELFNVNKEICNAIKFHSVGNIKMTLFDKIIFIADKIGRKNITPYIEELKSLSYKNIDEALILYLTNQKEKLEQNNKLFHPNSLILLNRLKNEIFSR